MFKSKLLPVFVLLFPLIIVLTQCLSETEKTDPRGKAFSGSASCISCHKDINNSYLHTAHFMASLPASAQSIHGSFLPGLNSVRYNNHSKVMMTKTDSGFYQTNYINGAKIQSARIDYVLGGIKGKSFLYWNENELFQLPVSYDVPKARWIVSPGYDTTMADFDRMITLRCLECHASNAKPEAPKAPSFSGQGEGFAKGLVILGIDCERCHGPAKQHVDFHTYNPTVKQAKYITRISSLPRDQKIDLCGTCHSGTNTITSRSIFNFKPGDHLTDYKKHPVSGIPVDYTHIDVHGNQVDMLKTSKCFISSQMDCNTCHNTHKNQRNDLAAFTRRCMTCHKTGDHNFCKMANKVDGSILKANCIACHMPGLPSKVIVNEEKPVLVNTHHIAIYPDEVQKIIKYLKK